jgi:hypothetical protein
VSLSKVASVNWISKKENKPVGRKKLYSLYTHLGWNYKGYGNLYHMRKRHILFSEVFPLSKA